MTPYCGINYKKKKTLFTSLAHPVTFLTYILCTVSAGKVFDSWCNLFFIYTYKIQNKKQYSSSHFFAIKRHHLNVNRKLDVVENAYNLSTQEAEVGDLEFKTSWTQNNQ